MAKYRETSQKLRSKSKRSKKETKRLDTDLSTDRVLRSKASQHIQSKPEKKESLKERSELVIKLDPWMPLTETKPTESSHVCDQNERLLRSKKEQQQNTKSTETKLAKSSHVCGKTERLLRSKKDQQQEKKLPETKSTESSRVRGQNERLLQSKPKKHQPETKLAEKNSTDPSLLSGHQPEKEHKPAKKTTQGQVAAWLPRLNEIVFGKMRGFSNWPGRVTNIDGTSIGLVFFGDNTTATLNVKNISTFDAGLKQFSPKEGKQIRLQKAIKEALYERHREFVNSLNVSK